MESPKDRMDEKLKLKSNSYRRNMASAFNRFLEETGLTSDEIYSRQRRIEREVALGEAEPYELDWLSDLVQRVVQQRIEEGVTVNYAKDIHKAVSFFCRVNHLKYSMSNHDLPSAEDIGKMAASHGQIRELMDNCEGLFKSRNQAIIMFLKDSGLRPHDLDKFTVGDYRQALRNSDQEGFARFNPIITNKKGVRAYVMIGFEAIHYIDKYLGDEELNRYLGGHGDGDPLFVSRDMDGRRGAKRGIKGINSLDISAIFNRLWKSMENGTQYSAYSLRKFNTSQLNSTTEYLGRDLFPMQMSYIYKLQGRKVRDSFGSYDRPEENGKLLEAYVQHYPKLVVYQASDEGKVEALTDRVVKLEGMIMDMMKANFKTPPGTTPDKIMLDILKNSTEIKVKRRG